VPPPPAEEELGEPPLLLPELPVPVEAEPDELPPLPVAEVVLEEPVEPLESGLPEVETSLVSPEPSCVGAAEHPAAMTMRALPIHV